MTVEPMETREERLDRLQTELSNLLRPGVPRWREPLEAFFDRSGMPELIADSGRPALIAKACQAMNGLIKSVGDAPVAAGNFQNQMTRVLSPDACATVSRSVDLESMRLVLESANALPPDIRLGLLPQLVTREACTTVGDLDDPSAVGELAACLSVLPQEMQLERMPLLLTPHATKTMSMGNGVHFTHVWAAATGAESLPAETRAEAVANIMSPHNCGVMARSGHARATDGTLHSLGHLPEPIRGERERLLLTGQARETIVRSGSPTYLARALNAAKTWPAEQRTSTFSQLLWPDGTPQSCELLARSTEPLPLVFATMAASLLESELRQQVLHHLLPQEALQMLAQKANPDGVAYVADAIGFLPSERKESAARELLSDRALSEVEHSASASADGVYGAAMVMRAARHLPSPEQADVARKLMTQRARESMVALPGGATRKYCVEAFSPGIPHLSKHEQAEWRVAVPEGAPQWQQVVALALHNEQKVAQKASSRAGANSSPTP